MDNLQQMLTEYTDLVQRQKQIKVLLQAKKGEIANAINAEGALKEAGKEHGQVTLKPVPGFRITAKIDRKISWENSILMDATKSMSKEQFDEFFELKLSVPEKKYEQLQAQARVSDKLAGVLDVVDAARTVELSSAKIDVVKED